MPSILVIDDEPQLRSLLKQMLERKGYQVDVASNGKEGIQKFRKQAADLIITDLIMPEKEGLETIMELRKDFPDVKIIAISGGGRMNPEGYLNTAKIFGASYTFSKPLENIKFLNAVSQLLA
jgi:CheY-like chemotaxis protein